MPNQDWIITPAALKPLLGKVTLLDVREPEEWAESRIEGATHIPLGEIATRVEKEIPNKDSEIVVYCAHGVRSMHALRGMAQMGYRRLRSLEGGIVAWDGQR